MDSLRKRYKELRLREIEIKKELLKRNRVPKMEVLQWCDAVDDVKKQVKRLEKSPVYKILGCFSLDSSINSILTRKLSKEVNRLWKRSQFPAGVYSPVIRTLVKQCPSRSQLFGTIWENLMDPNVRITGIYGDSGIGKTTAMMSVSDKLATSVIFNSIFWVTDSKSSDMEDQRVYQLQTALAQQMKLDLPESGRAVILLNALKKFHRFLIVIDGLCEALPLMMVGIPEPDRENRSKIVVISQDYSVCHIMKSDKIIKVEAFSSTEKWDLFASYSDAVVLAPHIIPLASYLVEVCPGRPLLINAISHAMRDEVSIQVWRNTVDQLEGSHMVFNLLKICYQQLKDELVQKCFFYCALLPNHRVFKLEELIRYWNEANFIHGDADLAIKTDTGLDVIRKLLDAKMMLMSEEIEEKSEDDYSRNLEMGRKILKISGEKPEKTEDCFKMAGMWRQWAITAMKMDLNSLCNSRYVKMVSKQMEQPGEIRMKKLQEFSIVAKDIFPIQTIKLAKDKNMFTFETVVQCPERPQLVDTIWESLMNRKVRVLSIYGSWGVGKTTAMAKISTQLAGIHDQYDIIIWVTFSKVSSLYQLQTDIALQINLTLPEVGRTAKLFEALEKMEKILVIIDDVMEVIPLPEVGIPAPSGDNRHKIVLISRDIQVCYLMKSDKIIRMDAFSLSEKWDLFVSKSGNMAPRIEALARRLVELCPGRPLIINAICHAMRDEVSIQVWRKTLQHLMNFETEDMVFEVSKICYECLRDTMVQRCFLYCALFPEDCHFNPEELIRYWMAENLIHGDADIITKREVGYKIMTKLLDANMLEMSAKREDDWLKMPYMWKEFAMRTMKDGPGFNDFAGHGWERMSYLGMAVDGKVSMIRNQIEVLRILPIPNSSVSTLLLRENPIYEIHPPFFATMGALQFLDLSYTWITELPSTISEVAQLRVLFLHYCTCLEKIPSLQKLTKLEVLSLSGTSITELPHGMEKLVSLRSLDLSETRKLRHIRAGMISALPHLEELRMEGSGLCKVDSDTVANYLLEMRCLKRLAILTIGSVCYGDLLDTIMCLQEHNLKVFSVQANGMVEDSDEDI